MITRFVIKDVHVPAGIVETMERRIHQRMDAYFKDEAEGDTVISVRITEQKNTYKVEMTMPYMGHTLRTENQEREISLPALDKGIDVLERQMKTLRTRLARDMRKKPPVAAAAADADVLVVGCGLAGLSAALAAAQLQLEWPLRAGIPAAPLAASGNVLVDVEISGHQFVVGVGLETHSHKIVFSL